jgi:hypothetical protein
MPPLPPPPDDPEGHAVAAVLATVCASTVTPKRVRFLWRPRVPLGEVTLWLGVGGLGKTLALAADLTAQITRATLEGDLDGPASVLVASGEDSREHTLVPRLIAAGADLDRVHFIAGGMGLPYDLDALEATIVHHGVRLVILDPVVSFLADDVDSHKDHSVRRALDPLSDLAQRLDVAVVPILHLNKVRSADLFTRASGSGAFWNAVRSAVAVTEDPDDAGGPGRVLWHGKANLAVKAPPLRFTVTGTTIDGGEEGPIEVAVVTWGEEDPGLEIGDALDRDTDRKPTKQDKAAELLKRELATGPRLRSDLEEIARDEGIGWRTVEAAKSDLGIESKQVSEPGHQGAGPSWWRLPGRGEWPAPGRSAETRATNLADLSLHAIGPETAGYATSENGPQAPQTRDTPADPWEPCPSCGRRKFGTGQCRDCEGAAA